MSLIFSPPYYEIGMDFAYKTPVFYAWSATRDRSGIITMPYPETTWTPKRDIAFTSGGLWSDSVVKEGGRLTPETLDHLFALNCIVTTDLDVSRDVVDVFTGIPGAMPLLSGPLKSALDKEFPNVFEFIELPVVWNETTQGPLPGGPYYLTNLLTRLDSWDKQKSKFYHMKRGDGSPYVEVGTTQRFIRSDLRAEFPIWRDKVTSDVICTERFREVAERAGCTEWDFTEIPTTAV